MSLRRNAARASAAILVLLATACSGGDGPTDSQEGADTNSDTRGHEDPADYDFQLPAPGDSLVRVDAMGVALLSTVLVNRDRTPSGDDNHNQYQNDSPDVQNRPSTLISFIHFLRALHSYWRDSLSNLGFEPCSDAPLGVVLAAPCTLQHLRFDEDPNEEGPRVLDAVLPDYITLDFDQPLRFPNGRSPREPISDKIFALGFLKMGGNCSGLDALEGVSDETKRRVPRDETGAPICTIETFADLPLQVGANDRPYLDKFPYLGTPWFYSAPSGEGTYFWPTTPRLEQPQ